ncbi:MAG: Tic20 family protein [Terracidiphilus sp.]
MPTPQKSGLSDNAIGATAYFPPFMPFMAIFYLAIRRYNKRPYVRFHAWQSLLFNIFAFALFYLLNFIAPDLSKLLGFRGLLWLFSGLGLIAFLIWLWCVVCALNGRRFKLPLIGEWADEQAYR